MGRERYVATRFCRVGYDCVARFFNTKRIFGFFLHLVSFYVGLIIIVFYKEEFFCSIFWFSLDLNILCLGCYQNFKKIKNLYSFLFEWGSLIWKFHSKKVIYLISLPVRISFKYYNWSHNFLILFDSIFNFPFLFLFLICIIFLL
jgi:hypothetical protein